MILTSFISAQNDSLKNIDYILENILENAIIEQENSPLFDLIEQYTNNPIDLNNSDKSEIMKLPLIDIESANTIVKYRKDNGRIFSYSELEALSNISPQIIKLLEVFTYLTKKEQNEIKLQSFINNVEIKLRSRFSQNIQDAEGYKNGYYLGSPSKIYNRLNINLNSSIEIGLLADKDAGESSITDFTSFFIKANNLFSGFNLIAGYYTFEFGQGLALWSPYAFAKGSDATNSIIKRARGISPYTSAGEYLYMKGAALNYSNNIFELSTFIDIANNDDFNLSKNNYGFTLSVLPINQFKISALYFNEIVKTNNELNSKNYSSLDHTSITYEFTYNYLFITGEFAILDNTLASINTLQLSLIRTFLIVASIRNYPSNYNSSFAQGFGENKGTNNEFGIYLGFKWRTELGIINFYLDQFKFPNSTSSIALPSSGNEISFSYELSPFSKTNLYFRYFSENKEVLELVHNENLIQNRKTDKFRFELIYEVINSIQFKSRTELLSLNMANSNEKGILLFQDVKYKYSKLLSLHGRIIFFQTDSFSSRIYEFENDLTGVMTNPALFGSGVKWYLLLKYNPINHLFISAKYSELYKPSEVKIGSGNSQVEGNIDNKIALQIDFTF